MVSEINTGGLKRFQHSGKVNYSSKEEEERYSRLGEEAYRISRENRKRKLMYKWLIGIGIAAVLCTVIIAVVVLK